MLAAVSGMTTNSLTTAGLAVGVGLLAVEHVRWWRGGGGAAAAGPGGGGAAKDPKQLVPFWFGVAFGTLAVACPAGMLGTGAGILRWGGNGLGGWVMSTMTGQSASAVANASAPALDQYGALIVTCLVIALFMLRKTFAKQLKGKWWRGVWAGTLLAIGTGTFAMIGDLVVPNVNGLGAWAIGNLVHGTLL
ncbi:hypothetical protein [Streptomyces sp. C1-2]|uniref:hypothetical protein n=1 Tax=Streptomyces sp. C1-2 TaxID=2720022 RepID=UPI00143255FB|nr:hypothetical protein [Streptomyces sp. C1-2]NJP74560.1 hypothetical protein [Streptomyces sp. C1-2]